MDTNSNDNVDKNDDDYDNDDDDTARLIWAVKWGMKEGA